MTSPVTDMIWEIKENYGLDSPSVFNVMLQVPRDKFVDKKYKAGNNYVVDDYWGHHWEIFKEEPVTNFDPKMVQKLKNDINHGTVSVA